jgi:hypothetical protein
VPTIGHFFIKTSGHPVFHEHSAPSPVPGVGAESRDLVVVEVPFVDVAVAPVEGSVPRPFVVRPMAFVANSISIQSEWPDEFMKKCPKCSPTHFCQD